MNSDLFLFPKNHVKEGGVGNLMALLALMSGQELSGCWLHMLFLTDGRTAVRLCLGFDCPCGHVKGGVKRNKRRVFGLVQSFSKHAFMDVFLLAAHTYLLSTYYGPGLVPGSELTSQNHYCREVYMAGADEDYKATRGE